MPRQWQVDEAFKALLRLMCRSVYIVEGEGGAASAMGESCATPWTVECTLRGERLHMSSALLLLWQTRALAFFPEVFGTLFPQARAGDQLWSCSTL